MTRKHRYNLKDAWTQDDQSIMYIIGDEAVNNDGQSRDANAEPCERLGHRRSIRQAPVHVVAVWRGSYHPISSHACHCRARRTTFSVHLFPQVHVLRWHQVPPSYAPWHGVGPTLDCHVCRSGTTATRSESSMATAGVWYAVLHDGIQEILTHIRLHATTALEQHLST